MIKKGGTLAPLKLHCSNALNAFDYLSLIKIMRDCHKNCLSFQHSNSKGLSFNIVMGCFSKILQSEVLSFSTIDFPVFVHSHDKRCRNTNGCSIFLLNGKCDCNAYASLKLILGSPCTSSRLSDLRNIFSGLDRKSTRLNSSHHSISYAVFCLKKKKKT